MISRFLILLTFLVLQFRTIWNLHLQNDDPVALNQIVQVSQGSDALIQLKGYELSGKELKYTIVDGPESGNLFQLSDLFIKYGYNPKKGPSISTNDSINDPAFRLMYKRPDIDYETADRWSDFYFVVSTGLRTSERARVTLVPPSGLIVGSNFLFNDDGWTVTGNKASSSSVKHDKSYRSMKMSSFIIGSDDLINTDRNKADQSLWHFQAPSKYTGDFKVAYGGSLDFSLVSFSGNLTISTESAVYLVEITSKAYNTRLVFPMKQPQVISSWPSSYSIPLAETAGWVQDSRNTLIKFRPPTRCTMINVLSSVSSMKILGDFSDWYETVGLDSVKIVNSQLKLPLCAQTSTCLCEQ